MTAACRCASAAARGLGRCVLLPLVIGAIACAPRVTGPAAPGEPRTLDDMRDVGVWSAAPATGVAMTIGRGAGRDGGDALRVDFDFRGGGGWAAFHRALPVRLPENYAISFWIRAEAPDNTLEFKLLDASGENVWWVRRPDFDFSPEWRQVTYRRRHVEFAWGPARGGELRDLATLEFAITAGSGGRGTVWIDDITLTPLEPVVPYDLTPVVTASSAAAGAPPAAAMDGDTLTVWRSAARAAAPAAARAAARDSAGAWLTIDFQRVREYGGLVVAWDEGARAADYDVQLSTDGAAWTDVRAVRGGRGARDYLALPETEARWLRLVLHAGDEAEPAIRDITVMPLEWGASQNAVFETVAAHARRGEYPKYLLREQSYWTVVGVSGDAHEALINEEGMVEIARRSLSIEPFLHSGDRLITWADGTTTQTLEQGELPIPSVIRDAGALRLTITAWADGPPGATRLWLRYRVENRGAVAARPTLFLALRPFQVNPSWQFLNHPGGVAPVHVLAYDAATTTVTANAAQRIVALSPPAAFGVARYDEGGIVAALRHGVLPAVSAARDDAGYASGALSYPLVLLPGASRDVVLVVPLHAAAATPAGIAAAGARAAGADSAGELAQAALDSTVARWRETLDHFDVALPGDAARIGRMMKSNVAYVLINRDGAAIQPGSRAYERSWIRDGSLTSAALLRLGQHEAVRAFIEWFAPFQYENGKVPCCVDARGADPVPEHDSHGQLIYLIAEYHRHTGDRALVERYWPNVVAAVAHIDSLRATRMTPAYRTPELLPYYGLVPESISHEGYSERPMHSYWDQLFVLKGLADAAYLGALLGRPEAARYAALRDEFRRDLVASFTRAMALHGIDYLPGAVELGDFDATSTTVAVTPVGAAHALPDAALRRTFEKYWEHFAARRAGVVEWDAYTPYELRTVGTFVRLGERARAHELLQWFLRDVRPAAWNHWAEVVFRDPAEPRFIGDMPHTWVGSDFIRSVVDMLVHERAVDDALVVGAGVLPEWVRAADGMSVRGIRTHHGTLDYAMRAAGDSVTVTFGGSVRAPAGGVIVRSPLDSPVRRARADGRDVPVRGGEVRLERLPRTLVMHY